MGRNEDSKRTSIGKKAVLVDRCHDGIHLYRGLENTYIKQTGTTEGMDYRFTLKRSPDNSAVVYSELGKTTTGKYAPFRDMGCIHDGDNVIAACASSLYIL